MLYYIILYYVILYYIIQLRCAHIPPPGLWLGTKINQKSNKIEPKIFQNPSKIRLLGALGASCGALGGVLGHLGSKSQHNHQKTDSLDPPGPPKLEPRSTRNSLKLVPEASQRVMIFFIDFWVRLWWHLVPTWLQLGRPNPSKIQPCWSQDPPKIGSRCQPICGLIFDRPGTLFFLIFLRSWKAETPKIIKNILCF